jgi:methionyl-tRNA synthetase
LLANVAENLRIHTALLYVVLPFTMAKVWEQLGLGDINEGAVSGELNKLEWGGLQPGTKLGPLAPIFPRADKGLAQIMIDMEANNAAASTPLNVAVPSTATSSTGTTVTQPSTAAAAQDLAGSLAIAPAVANTLEAPSATSGDAVATASAAAPAETIPQIGIDDFMKVELRVAKVLVAERIPKADKLLRLEVDLGYEKRQILSGIAEWYTPEELIGRKIVIVANLAPRKMRGLESHGMLLAASGEDHGKPVLATFGDDIELGARVR